MLLNGFKMANLKEISEQGVNFIKSFEGFSSVPYNDGVGVMTIGYGHALRKKDKHLKKITEEQAVEILKEDVSIAVKNVNNLVKVDITQNQFDALVSFAFNVGVGNLKNSTLLKKLNQGDYIGAADEFLRWNKGRVNGVMKEMKGLTRRRVAERALFLEP